MSYYVNTGAPIPRASGEFIESGAVFVPTKDEVRQLAYKLRPATSEEVAAVRPVSAERKSPPSKAASAKEAPRASSEE